MNLKKKSNIIILIVSILALIVVGILIVKMYNDKNVSDEVVNSYPMTFVDIKVVSVENDFIMAETVKDYDKVTIPVSYEKFKDVKKGTKIKLLKPDSEDSEVFEGQDVSDLIAYSDIKVGDKLSIAASYLNEDFTVKNCYFESAD